MLLISSTAYSFLYAQENLTLIAPIIAPSPLQPVQDNGDGCFSFKIQNVNNPGYPNPGDTEIAILMDNITPPNGLSDLSSDMIPGAYTWSYDAMTNSYHGIQSAPIGFLYSEEITVCFDVTANSFCPIEDNGFTATATIINGDDGNPLDNEAFSYTCTSQPITLSVRFSLFDIVINNGEVNLTWETNSEVNNQGFEIQYSKDSRQWEAIGFVVGQGNSNEVQEYSYEHEDPKSGINYYRLKQIDFNSKFLFSEVRSIDVKAQDKTPTIFPNPTVDCIQLIGIDSESNYWISNASGENIHQGLITNDQICLTKLVPGFYLIRIETQNDNQVLSFIKN